MRRTSGTLTALLLTAAAVDAPVNTVRSRMRLARESMLEHIRRDPRFAELREDA